MAEYSYGTSKGKAKTFRAMTGLDLGEFKQLLPYFQRAYTEQMSAENHASDTRQGRPSSLATLEDKLFFYSLLLKDLPVTRRVGLCVQFVTGR